MRSDEVSIREEAWEMGGMDRCVMEYGLRAMLQNNDDGWKIRGDLFGVRFSDQKSAKARGSQLPTPGMFRNQGYIPQPPFYRREQKNQT